MSNNSGFFCAADIKIGSLLIFLKKGRKYWIFGTRAICTSCHFVCDLSYFARRCVTCVFLHAPNPVVATAPNSASIYRYWNNF